MSMTLNAISSVLKVSVKEVAEVRAFVFNQHIQQSGFDEASK